MASVRRAISIRGPNSGISGSYTTAYETILIDPQNEIVIVNDLQFVLLSDNRLRQGIVGAMPYGMLVRFDKSTPGGGGVLDPIIPIWQEPDS
ncbi:MAG: hypothetical protein ACYDBJ_03470 [Aggregatilineales bacterium]